MLGVAVADFGFVVLVHNAFVVIKEAVLRVQVPLSALDMFSGLKDSLGQA